MVRPYTPKDVAKWVLDKDGMDQRLTLFMRDGEKHSARITDADRDTLRLECQFVQLALDRINAERNAAPVAKAPEPCEDPDHDHRAPLFISTYKGKDGWRWRLMAINGRKVGTSGEVFASKSSAERAADRLVGANIQRQET